MSKEQKYKADEDDINKEKTIDLEGATQRMGAGRDFTLNMMDKFVKLHMIPQWENVEKIEHSTDQLAMYAAVHSMVGSSRTAGFNKFGMIMDKMQ